MTHTKDTKPTTFHFPEPWRYEFSPYGIVDILAPDTTGEYPQGIYVAEIDTNDVGRFISHEQHEANARRICAAVNACKGISTEALEQGIVAVLLAKLKTLLEQIDEDVPTDITTRHFANAYDEALATLAKATGRAVCPPATTCAPSEHRPPCNATALERGTISEMRHVLGEIVAVAGDLDAAIDGATGQFDAERSRLNAALRAAQAVLGGGMALDLHELLANRGQIARIWSIKDVQEIRPDLSDEQAWEVLDQVERKHDAMLGVTWDTLETVADDLFGDAPETDSPE